MIWALTNYASNDFFFSLKQDIILWIHKSCGSVATSMGGAERRQRMLSSDIIIPLILNVFKVLVLSLSWALN